MQQKYEITSIQINILDNSEKYSIFVGLSDIFQKIILNL